MKLEDKFSEDDKFYYLNGHNGYWIRKGFGNGKVFAYFLEHVGEEISIEKIWKISGWKSTKSNMERYLKPYVNNWSPYNITAVDNEKGLHYKMKRKSEKELAELKAS